MRRAELQASFPKRRLIGIRSLGRLVVVVAVVTKKTKNNPWWPRRLHEYLATQKKWLVNLFFILILYFSLSESGCIAFPLI